MECKKCDKEFEVIQNNKHHISGYCSGRCQFQYEEYDPCVKTEQKIEQELAMEKFIKDKANKHSVWFGSFTSMAYEAGFEHGFKHGVEYILKTQNQ